MSKKTFVNKCHIEGLLYQHTLEKKTTGPNSKEPGTDFITGTLEIATNDELTNIVPIHFTYVTEKTNSGKTNQTFATLMNIINNTYSTYITEGESASKIKVDTAIGLNEFYSDRSGTEELVSVKRNEGGFAHVIDKLNDDENQRNTFECDMLITKVTRFEADEEKSLPERVTVKGCVFDFRKSLLPIELTAVNPHAMNYFESLNASEKEPVFTQVWGRQISTTTCREIRTESAFGDDNVKTVESTRKEFIITGAAKTPYIWDDESTLTAQELNEMITTRNTYLATMKQRQDEYKSSQTQNKTPSQTAKGGFNF